MVSSGYELPAPRCREKLFGQEAQTGRRRCSHAAEAKVGWHPPCYRGYAACVRGSVHQVLNVVPEFAEIR
jgi:hypothetical protein